MIIHVLEQHLVHVQNIDVKRHLASGNYDKSIKHVSLNDCQHNEDEISPIVFGYDGNKMDDFIRVPNSKLRKGDGLFCQRVSKIQFMNAFWRTPHGD